MKSKWLLALLCCTPLTLLAQTRYIVDDYRAVGRMKLPFHVQRIRPNSSIDMRFTSVRVDVAVDTLRERPPARRGGEVAPERSRPEAARPDPQAPADTAARSR